MDEIRQYILSHWKKETVAMMAAGSGASVNTVWAACRRLKIDPITALDIKKAFILDNFERLTIEQMADQLKLSDSGVRGIIEGLGLHPGLAGVPAERISKALQEEINDRMFTKKFVRPAAVYVQYSSPYKIADKLRDINITSI